MTPTAAHPTPMPEHTTSTTDPAVSSGVTAIEQAVDARCVIEVAVADAVIDRGIPDEDLHAVHTHAARVSAAVAAAPADTHALRLATDAFYGTFVGLLHDEALLEAYRRLQRPGFEPPRERASTNSALAYALAQACARRHAESAKQLLYRHAAEAKRAARAAAAPGRLEAVST